ncbi:hypothetical protein D3C86_1386970 [compost metagenome]
MATAIAAGVASPSAHGQVTISTEMVLRMAASSPRGQLSQNVTAATSTSRGKKTTAALSARTWEGARAASASLTHFTIWARVVSAPTFSARITRAPSRLRVPAVTGLAGSLETGSDSPLSMASSTWPAPDSTRPSTGMVSPGRTRRRSPTRMAAVATVSSPSSPSRVALGAASRQ